MFGMSEKAFGNPGFGGSYGYADRDTQTGTAYAMNKLHHADLDPREKALSKVTFECIENL
jgi:CubicO group peptidase (beta-lactamase class C family)